MCFSSECQIVLSTTSIFTRFAVLKHSQFENTSVVIKCVLICLNTLIISALNTGLIKQYDSIRPCSHVVFLFKLSCDSIVISMISEQSDQTPTEPCERRDKLFVQRSLIPSDA